MLYGVSVDNVPDLKIRRCSYYYAHKKSPRRLGLLREVKFNHSLSNLEMPGHQAQQTQEFSWVSFLSVNYFSEEDSLDYHICIDSIVVLSFDVDEVPRGDFRDPFVNLFEGDVCSFSARLMIDES